MSTNLLQNVNTDFYRIAETFKKLSQWISQVNHLGMYNVVEINKHVGKKIDLKLKQEILHDF